MAEQKVKANRPPLIDALRQTEIYNLWLSCNETAGDLLIRGIEAQRNADMEWFKQANYVKLADDQSLPDTHLIVPSQLETQREMIEKGWRKVIPQNSHSVETEVK